MKGSAENAIIKLPEILAQFLSSNLRLSSELVHGDFLLVLSLSKSVLGH